MQRLTRRGLRLAQFTVAYNVVEGAVAITAGLLAGLVSVVGFGVDSAIESVSAVLVGLPLSARLRHGEADEVRERRTLRAVAVTFFVLAGYVIFEGIRSLAGHREPVLPGDEREPVPELEQEPLQVGHEGLLKFPLGNPLGQVQEVEHVRVLDELLGKIGVRDR